MKRNKKLTEENTNKIETFKKILSLKILDEKTLEKRKEKANDMKHKQMTDISRKIMKDYISNRENKNYIKATLEDQKKQSSFY